MWEWPDEREDQDHCEKSSEQMPLALNTAILEYVPPVLHMVGSFEDRKVGYAMRKSNR